MQADVRRAVCECCLNDSFDDLAGVCRRHAAAGSERPEVDFEAECLGGRDGGDDVRTWFALDERFDGELEQQHADAL